MGLAPADEAVELAGPKIAVLSGPRPFRTLDGRLVGAADFRWVGQAEQAAAAEGPHHLAGELAARIEVGRARDQFPVGQVDAAVSSEGGWRAERATLYRTARPLLRGAVAVSAW